MVVCGISPPFGRLSPTLGQVTHALLTRAPLYSPRRTRDFSRDLHVLGTPPAFILSRDQTLKFNPYLCFRISHYSVFKDQTAVSQFNSLFRSITKVKPYFFKLFF